MLKAEHTGGGCMGCTGVILAWVGRELWFPGVPLASIIHVLEGPIATQPPFGYWQAWGALNLAPALA